MRLVKDVRDARGDHILEGSYVRLPNGKHAWVVRLNLDDYRGRPLATLEHERGGHVITTADSLVTVKPTQKALAARKRVATLRRAISESAHRAYDRSRSS